MSAITIAQKDFQDAIRSWMLLGLTAVFVVFTAGAAYVYIALGAIGGSGGGEQVSSLALINFLSGLTVFFIPLIGLIVGYKSIVSERESGSIALLLSLPHTRRDVVLGKVLGRTGVVFVSAIVGFLIAAGVVVVLSGSLSFGSYVLFVLASLALALTFVSLAVSFSAATRSSTLSLVGAGALTSLFIFPVIWSLIPTLVRFILNEYTPLTLDMATQPEWAQFFVQLDPTAAYSNVLHVLIPDLTSGPLAGAGGDVPFYLAPSFGFVILAAWIVVPLMLGYYRFNSTDL
ncbi:ABC transporter permease [Halostagnicola kamekurae]|uniref:ABC-2 type transport system permease protein n=1 Tax=Halostagnicola kamekurae TaxID=619731 RepID=A0A1I6QQD7_9EURY|nr:ABC transporter permease [Halostagnicola kamekurae]SFS54673.1 ABC-2 type transport system permease protein [Halostagnicola kamekurae]